MSRHDDAESIAWRLVELFLRGNYAIEDEFAVDRHRYAVIDEIRDTATLRMVLGILAAEAGHRLVDSHGLESAMLEVQARIDRLGH